MATLGQIDHGSICVRKLPVNSGSTWSGQLQKHLCRKTTSQLWQHLPLSITLKRASKAPQDLVRETTEASVSENYQLTMATPGQIDYKSICVGKLRVDYMATPGQVDSKSIFVGKLSVNFGNTCPRRLYLYLCL